MINIRAEHLEIIKDILGKHVPEFEVRVFGSRINGNTKNYSDLDIVLIGKQNLSINQLRKLEDSFQESDLPFRIDVIDWNRISDEFKKIIEKGFEVLQKSAD